MMSTMFYPLVTFVLLVICIGYWAVTALYLATSGQPQYIYWASNTSTPGCENVPVNMTCDPMIVCEYTVAVFRHTRRGLQIPLPMVVSHHVVAGN